MEPAFLFYYYLYRHFNRNALEFKLFTGALQQLQLFFYEYEHILHMRQSFTTSSNPKFNLVQITGKGDIHRLPVKCYRRWI